MPLHDIEFRRAMARIFHISVRHLLRTAGYEVDESHHSLYAEKVAAIIDELPEDKQKIALNLIEALTK